MGRPTLRRKSGDLPFSKQQMSNFRDKSLRMIIHAISRLILIKMNKKSRVLGLLCLSTSFFGFAQQQTDSTKVEQLDEVVITDSRFALKRENSGKTVIKINKREIERNQGKNGFGIDQYQIRDRN